MISFGKKERDMEQGDKERKGLSRLDLAYIIVTFFLVLFVGYVYVWRKGVLDWGPAARRPRSHTDQKAA